MDKKLLDPEMPISENGKVYHLGLGPKDNLPQNIFLVGDPSRVFKVAKYFDSEPVIRQNREFITAIGNYQGLAIAVIGTGIGPANTEIVANELHILNEYDHTKKEWRPPTRQLRIIRLGTCATPQKNIPVGSLAISMLAIGFDNLDKHYPFYSNHTLITTTSKAINSVMNNACSYVSMPSPGMLYFLTEACKKIGLELQVGKGYYCGITASTPGFYNPQGRQIGRLPYGPFNNIQNILASFQCFALKIINIEMESAIMFRILSEILQYRAGTICAVLANRATGEIVSPEEYEASIDRCIQAGLEAMKLLNNK
ncbi:MAG: hypothetical protein Q8N90_01205 [bacterium]|nr:hypothetical protein [bacterium]